MRTVGFKKSLGSCPPDFDRCTGSLEDALAAGDIIVNCLPSTPHTLGLLSGAALQACAAKQPLFLNCGRYALLCLTVARRYTFVLLQCWLLVVFGRGTLLHRLNYSLTAAFVVP